MQVSLSLYLPPCKKGRSFLASLRWYANALVSFHLRRPEQTVCTTTEPDKLGNEFKKKKKKQKQRSNVQQVKLALFENDGSPR